VVLQVQGMLHLHSLPTHQDLYPGLGGKEQQREKDSTTISTRWQCSGSEMRAARWECSGMPSSRATIAALMMMVAFDYQPACAALSQRHHNTCCAGFLWKQRAQVTMLYLMQALATPDFMRSYVWPPPVRPRQQGAGPGPGPGTAGPSGQGVDNIREGGRAAKRQAVGPRRPGTGPFWVSPICINGAPNLYMTRVQNPQAMAAAKRRAKAQKPSMLNLAQVGSGTMADVPSLCVQVERHVNILSWRQPQAGKHVGVYPSLPYLATMVTMHTCRVLGGCVTVGPRGRRGLHHHHHHHLPLSSSQDPAHHHRGSASALAAATAPLPLTTPPHT
jgi:hypothetical protein